MKKSIFSFLAVSFLFSCKARTDQSNANSMAYQKSKTYLEYLKGYENKAERMEADKIYLTLMGEESFLNLKKDQFYILYVYEEARDTLCHIYVIKSCNGISVASHKVNNNNSNLLENGSLEVYKGTFENYKIDNSMIMPVKNAINKAVGMTKKVLPKNYESPLRVAFYFDGQDYHRLSAFQLEESDLNVLDSTIRNFKPFIAGRQ